MNLGPISVKVFICDECHFSLGKLIKERDLKDLMIANCSLSV